MSSATNNSTDPYDNMNDDDFLALAKQSAYLAPHYLLPVVVAFACLLVIGLIGNFLVVFVVARNSSMRTPTNIFLVNLALSDFLVLIFCLPPTVLWDVTSTWWFGTMPCKIINVLQIVSVTVSLLTMVAISVERWHAVCFLFAPRLKTRYTLLIVIVLWSLGASNGLSSLLLDMRSEPHKGLRVARPQMNTTLGSTCQPSTAIYHVYWQVEFVLLYLIPLSVVGVMYGVIAYVLWVKSVPPGEAAPVHKEANGSANRLALPVVKVNDDRRNSTYELESSVHNSFCHNGHTSANSQAHSNRQILGRRKAAKMLISVVVIFAICYLPTFIKNLNFEWFPKGRQYNLAVRFMMYFNSCINPIIYNFMSEKFQAEFRKTCCYCCTSAPPPRRPHPTTENATLLARSPSRFTTTPTRPAAAAHTNGNHLAVDGDEKRRFSGISLGSYTRTFEHASSLSSGNNNNNQEENVSLLVPAEPWTHATHTTSLKRTHRTK